MSLFSKIFGPESKYDRSLPYTYEARIAIIEGEEDYNSYFSDTICGLIEYLDQNGISPQGVRILEIYREKESAINPRLFATSEDKWLFKPEICRSFREHYKGHIEDGKCSFRDRDREGCGP